MGVYHATKSHDSKQVKIPNMFSILTFCIKLTNTNRQTGKRKEEKNKQRGELIYEKS